MENYIKGEQCGGGVLRQKGCEKQIGAGGGGGLTKV
jgi:hypothetical protein